MLPLRFPFSTFHTPSPSGLPLSQGEKVDDSFPCYFVPLRQGAKRTFRRMTECHSVPSEGRKPRCDVG